jgi:hypothetical protein
MTTPVKKRKSGIPTGNAGGVFRHGRTPQAWDAQLADRNTKGYDLLVGLPSDKSMRKVQVRTVRLPPWYVSKTQFA